MARLRGLGLFLALTLAAIPPCAFAADAAKPVKEIRVEGAVRADKNTVRFYIKTQPGQPYDPRAIQEEIKKIYSLGYFDDIRLDAREEPDGLILTYLLKEKPFIRDVIFTGVKEVEKKLVIARVKSKKGSFFRQDFIPWDEQRIQQLYRDKGYYFTSSRAVVHKLAGNQVDVEYLVEEGAKIGVAAVRFRGVKSFSPQQLQGQIETAPKTWTSFLSDTGAYKRDALKADTLRLESFYHDHGFIQVKIRDPEVEIDRERQRINVSFPVDEGDQFYTGDITIIGDDVYSAAEIEEQVRLKKGDVFNRGLFREDIFTITDLYSQKGYAYANVNPDFSIDPATRAVNVRLETRKGPKVYLGRITITGNDKTRDRVVRRQFLLHEGDLFNSEKLRKSRQRVNRLGFFESAELEQKSRKETGLVDIDVKVVERQTGQFSFAVGYSSVENLVLQGQLKWTNLLGRGQELAVSVDTSSRRNDYSVSFTEPGLFDGQLPAGGSLYSRLFEYDAFSSRNVGGNLSLGRAIGEDTWLRLGYKYERNTVEILNRESAGIFLLAQEGERTTGSISPSLVYDTKDDFYSPTTGTRFETDFELAGLGGEERFYKASAEYTRYWPLFLDFVGMFHSRIGYAAAYDDRELPLYERYFMGGPRTLRGYTIRQVGPLDENGEAIGGEALLLFNAELQYRFTRYFRGFLLYDRGNVYGSGDQQDSTTDRLYDLGVMRHSWGFGVHFFSPIGPISVIYGFKLDQRPGETPSEFHFTVGGAF